MSAASTTRAALAAAALLLATPAVAQRGPDAPAGQAHDEARARFERGVAYIEVERWADAITELQRAREIRPTPAVLYNLGLAYRAVGRNREAMAVFTEFVRTAGSGANPELLSRVRGYLREAAAGLARLDLDVDPPTARVILDGTLVLTRLAIAVDPGRHVVVIEAPGYASQTRSLDLYRGTQQRLALRLVPFAAAPAPAPAATLAPAPAPPPEAPLRAERSVLRSPWLWLGVGVALAGAGVATYFALREEPAGYQGSLGTVTDALSLGRWR